MGFEENLRAKISDAPFQSAERRLLKIILGEFKRGKDTDDAGYGIVRKLIRSNEESLKRIRIGDRRRDECEDENLVLKSLLK